MPRDAEAFKRTRFAKDTHKKAVKDKKGSLDITIVKAIGATWEIVNDGDAAFLRGVDGLSANHLVRVGRTRSPARIGCRYEGVSWTKIQLDSIPPV